MLQADDLDEAYELGEDIDTLSGTTSEQEFAEALSGEIVYTWSATVRR